MVSNEAALHAAKYVIRLHQISLIHKPIEPPEGYYLIGSKPTKQYCEGCDVGDPFLMTEWPCETRRICNEVLEPRNG